MNAEQVLETRRLHGKSAFTLRVKPRPGRFLPELLQAAHYCDLRMNPMAKSRWMLIASKAAWAIGGGTIWNSRRQEHIQRRSRAALFVIS
jgi:hypothetical protein